MNCITQGAWGCEESEYIGKIPQVSTISSNASSAPSTVSSAPSLHTEVMSIFSKINTDACACADRILLDGSVRSAILQNAHRGISEGGINVKYISCMTATKISLNQIGACLKEKTGLHHVAINEKSIYYRAWEE
jgi:hypothetical protein